MTKYRLHYEVLLGENQPDSEAVSRVANFDTLIQARATKRMFERFIKDQTRVSGLVWFTGKEERDHFESRYVVVSIGDIEKIEITKVE